MIRKEKGKYFLNKKIASKKEILSKIISDDFLLQEKIKQHEAISRLNPTSVNTIRIVTTKYNDAVNVLSVVIRIGTSSDKVVDNAATGGTYVAIDEAGRLQKYGYYHPGMGTKAAIHPVSNVTYLGYQIPYWDEVIRLVKNAHEIVPDINTIGWDVAITDKGPILIEGNDNYEISIMQDADCGLKKKWYEAKCK